jgi:hypothetical protein
MLTFLREVKIKKKKKKKVKRRVSIKQGPKNNKENERSGIEYPD